LRTDSGESEDLRSGRLVEGEDIAQDEQTRTGRYSLTDEPPTNRLVAHRTTTEAHLVLDIGILLRSSLVVEDT